MPRFKVRGGVRVSAYTLVDAPDEKAAIAIARDREGALAPHGWSQDGVDPTEMFVVDNADGTLFDCKIEPMDKGDRDAWLDRDEADVEFAENDSDPRDDD